MKKLSLDYSKALDFFKEEEVKKQCREVMNEKVNDMVARRIEFADPIVNRQGKVGQESFTAVGIDPAYVCKVKNGIVF